MYTFALIVTLTAIGLVVLAYRNPNNYTGILKDTMHNDNQLSVSIALNAVLFCWLLSLCIKHVL